MSQRKNDLEHLNKGDLITIIDFGFITQSERSTYKVFGFNKSSNSLILQQPDPYSKMMVRTQNGIKRIKNSSREIKISIDNCYNPTLSDYYQYYTNSIAVGNDESWRLC